MSARPERALINDATAAQFAAALRRLVNAGWQSAVRDQGCLTLAAALARSIYVNVEPGEAVFGFDIAGDHYAWIVHAEEKDRAGWYEGDGGCLMTYVGQRWLAGTLPPRQEGQP